MKYTDWQSKYAQTIESAQLSDVHQLRLNSKLPKDELDFVINQIIGRTQAKSKLPEWFENPAIIFPSPLSMEQCSSQFTAKVKADIIGKVDSLVDVTGGFGVDLYYSSLKCNQAFHIEQNTELSQIVEHNFKTLNCHNIQCIEGDGLVFLENLKSEIDCIYIDPSRRSDEQSRVFMIEDCEPNLVEIESFLLEKSRRVIAKLSPLLDIHNCLQKLKHIDAIYVIAYRNEVKELLFSFALDAKKNPTRHAINILNQQNAVETFQADKSKENIELASQLEEYIYEPNKAVLKADLQDALGEKHNMKKLHPFSHLYTSPKLHLSFPGRVFSLLASVSAQEKIIRKRIPTKKANVIVRNFPLKAPQLVKKLKLTEGGNEYLLATTLWDESKQLLHCHRIK